ncbi:MAG: hypothetical protein OXC19_23570, partial [Bryobacterales bacterium]|nr:hypothetical protein [Bryobacterales bacterium]
PLLDRIALGNAALAPIVDAMTFRGTSEGRRYISYRDLSVQQLGSIYERLLEHEVAREGAGVVVRPNALARKDSGSYYTPESLVRLIIRETVGPKVEDARAAFRRAARELAQSSGEPDAADLGVCPVEKIGGQKFHPDAEPLTMKATIDHREVLLRVNTTVFSHHDVRKSSYGTGS